MYVVCTLSIKVILYIQPLLPSPCVTADAEMFLAKCAPGDVLKYGCIATCKEFMHTCMGQFTDVMETRAQQVSHTPFQPIPLLYPFAQDISKNPSLLSELSSPQKGSDKRDRRRNARQADRKTTEIKFLDIPKVFTVCIDA